MEKIGITKISSKGQIVIPVETRKNFNQGEKIIIIQGDGKLILKKASEADKNFQEDLEFARRTEGALKRIEEGEYISVDSDNLEEEMMKW